MSFVVAQPDSLATAARELHEAGSALAARNAAAATPTTGVVPAAAEEVSPLTAAQFAMPAVRGKPGDFVSIAKWLGLVAT